MNFLEICFVLVTLSCSSQCIMGQTDELEEVVEVNHPSSSSGPIYVNFGIPGLDFPNFTQIPYGIRFSCREKVPGFYANPETDCQVYHQCVEDGRSYSFLCGMGTIFNQRALTCDHWYNYDCRDAVNDYEQNLKLIQQEIDLESV